MVQQIPDPERRLPASTLRTPAELFNLLWIELTDILGSAAVAILLRRSQKIAASRGLVINSTGQPSSGRDLDQLSITREGLEYRYTVPAAWAGSSPAAMEELRQLLDRLRPMLAALTGEVVLKRLDALHEFRNFGISFAPAPALPQVGDRT